MDYKEHYINNSKNHISGWYIDTGLCAEILSLSQQRRILFSEIDRGFRNYQYCELEKLSQNLTFKYHTVLKDLLTLYISQYPMLQDCYPLAISTNPNTNKPIFKVQKYKAGSNYSDLHCENDGPIERSQRVLAFMTYLNDIEEAGTYFPLQNFTSKSQQGLTLLWPAYFTHPHNGLPANSSEKTIITGWFNWKPLKKIDPITVITGQHK